MSAKPRAAVPAPTLSVVVNFMVLYSPSLSIPRTASADYSKRSFAIVHGPARCDGRLSERSITVSDIAGMCRPRQDVFAP